MTIALVSAIGAHLQHHLDPYETAQLAFQIEREEVGVVGGKQDQYASAFGGINFIEFHRDSTLVTPLRVPVETIFELEYRLCYAYVGGTRVYSNIVKKQQENFSTGVASAVEAMSLHSSAIFFI